MLKKYEPENFEQKRTAKKKIDFGGCISVMERHKGVCCFIQTLSFIYWIDLLRKGHANYIIYLLCAGIAFCSLGIRMTKQEDNKKCAGEGIFNLILAGVFGIFIVIGNYEIMAESSGVHRWLTAAALFCSSVLVFFNVFDAAFLLFSGFKSRADRVISAREKIIFFLIPFFIFITIDLIYLFWAVYPGVITQDSISQLTQIQMGTYTNHHPFYQTMIIKFFTTIGMKLFHDINAAVATYLVFQILLMALTFSYVVVTVYEISKSKLGAVCVILFYALMPYHWNYSCTMWKDIIWGITCTLFTVSLYRARKRIGNNILNYACVFISSVGICIFRSNGVFVYFITLISLIIVFRNRERKLLQIAVAAFIIALIMKGPVLNALNVKSPDTIEALSIPAQQIARVIYNGQEIEAADMELLEKIVDVNAVKEKYKMYTSDPVKTLVRGASGNEVILANKAEYFALWARLGLRYPGTYIAAWVEQTKGYWNAGYDYWFCSTAVVDNKLGVSRSVKSERLFEFTKNKINDFRTNTFLCAFVSIGFCFWIYLVLCWFNITSKRDGWIETILFIAIIISLCIATPVFAEFRYSYALYSSIPFVIFSAFLSNNISEEKV